MSKKVIQKTMQEVEASVGNLDTSNHRQHRQHEKDKQKRVVHDVAKSCNGQNETKTLKLVCALAILLKF